VRREVEIEQKVLDELVVELSAPRGEISGHSPAGKTD